MLGRPGTHQRAARAGHANPAHAFIARGLALSQGPRTKLTTSKGPSSVHRTLSIFARATPQVRREGPVSCAVPGPDGCNNLRKEDDPADLGVSSCLACSSPKHDLSLRLRPYAFQHEMSLARVCERQDCTHPCSQLSAIGEVSDLRQMLACNVDEKERGFDAMAFRNMLIRNGTPPKSVCRRDGGPETNAFGFRRRPDQ